MLPIWYSEYKELIDNSVEKYLTEYFKSEENSWLDIIKQASIYACKWWKKIRSILALEFFLIFSKTSFVNIRQNDDIIKFCIALELLHSYSLIHDDLPAMDNDIYRRWELTVWKKYWEANAILVWDLLNSLSFELLSEIWNTSLIKYFWKSVWFSWMVWGQVLDLYYENSPKELTLENLIEIHNKKTGALIETSLIWWLLISEYSWEYKKYYDFWKKIGLAFQVKDDLLDVEGTCEETGKSVGWENKWFVYFMWIDKTHKYLDNLIHDCKNIINPLKSEKLNFLVNYIWSRKK
jgi:geranylgeranyl diphosphate synthase type II